jgi:hypothetical protein
MGAFFTFLSTTAGKWLLLVTICLVSLAVISRHWGCSKPPRPPKPPRVVKLEVVSVPTGNTIEIRQSKRRTAIVTLSSVAAPASGDALADEARDNLARIAGGRIRLEVPRRLGDDGGDESESTDADAMLEASALEYEHWFKRHVCDCEQCASAPTSDNLEPICTESFHRLQAALRGNLSGVCYGETGACLQLEQLASGMVKVVGEVPAEWAAAERDAKEKKLGMWR